MFHDQQVFHKWHVFVILYYFYVQPTDSYRYIQCGFIPSAVWRSLIIFQLFRCRNLALNRDVFPVLVAGMWGIVSIGGIHMPPCLSTPVHSDTPIHLDSPICLYAPYLPCTSVCPPKIFVPHLYSHLSWVLGASVHLSDIPVSVSTSIASQLITAAPHHCGLLLYWPRCLWMYSMLHAVVPFFVEF